MHLSHRSALGTLGRVALGVMLVTGTAQAQPAPLPEASGAGALPQDRPLPTEQSSLPATSAPPPTAPAYDPAGVPPPAGEAGPKEPKRGDFDAGGLVRLPSGPDEKGEFATFNWVAVDLRARYYLLDSVTLDGKVPLAVVKPDNFAGAETKLLGGFTAGLEAKLPMPPQPGLYETEVGLVLTGAYMREGAMLLSDKDYPLFIGDLQPGFSVGLRSKVKLSSLIDFSLTPLFVYQRGEAEAQTGLQLPLALIVKLGSLLKVSADAGVYTGDDFSFGGDDGGRIAAGGSVTLKIGPIVLHAGAGVASLLTGGLYPTISDSLYIDLDARYQK
jgi:hypothetical protein